MYVPTSPEFNRVSVACIQEAIEGPQTDEENYRNHSERPVSEGQEGNYPRWFFGFYGESTHPVTVSGKEFDTFAHANIISYDVEKERYQMERYLFATSGDVLFTCDSDQETHLLEPTQMEELAERILTNL